MRSMLFQLLFVLMAITTRGQSCLRNYSTPEFSLQVPDLWKIDASGYGGTEVRLVAPVDTVTGTSGQVTLQLVYLGPLQLTLEEYLPTLRKRLASIADSGRFALHPAAAGAAWEAVFTKTDRHKTNYVLERYFILDRHAYFLAFTAPQNRYRYWENEAQQVLASFRLEKAAFNRKW